MNDMFGRLKVLLNNLEALGQTYSKAQINRKVLESFPKVWEPKTTTTQEARDLENLAWDELLGIQRVHKVHLQNREHFQKKNFVALNFEETHFRREEKKSLSKALKVQMQETDGSDNSNASTDDEWIKLKEKFKASASENTELRKSNEDLKKKNQTLEKSLEQASMTDESSIVEKLIEEVVFITEVFEKFLQSPKTLTVLLKFHQHPYDKSGLGLKKGTTSFKSPSDSNKCDLCDNSSHFKFKCIHKKRQMSKGTNSVGPKKI
ncbi:hypothetical protein D0Y65_023842 [Glycine soja]|uniref:Uncharacterized protein n=1 Tax=Glycine soja TaxID=3848 RepID=A0A445IZQ5_GLYSO|nr:hypothetical protein D0Y65_023842 [Glycine soja]